MTYLRLWRRIWAVAMKLNDEAKSAVNELGEAINSAIGKSVPVSEAIERLREIGYEPNLSLKLEIGLMEITEPLNTPDEEIDFELTEEDIKTLRRMRILVDAD